MMETLKITGSDEGEDGYRNVHWDFQCRPATYT